MVQYVQLGKDTFSTLVALRQQIENLRSIFVKEISISNFRCFPVVNNENGALKISFNTPSGEKGSGLTVLLGENNSGKSTVLRAIELFSTDDETLDDMLARHELNASYVNDLTKGAEIHLNTSKGKLYLKTINDSEKLEWQCDNKNLKEEFKYSRIYNLCGPRRFLEALLNTRHSDVFRSGPASSRLECPRAEKIFRTKVYRGNGRDGESKLIEKTSCGRSLPAAQLGSGDLQFRHIENRIPDNDETSEKMDTCHLFLLDEPETCLHPKAIQALVDMLWEASAKVQIILASHSPVLIEAVYNKAKGAYDEAEKKAMVKKPASLPIGLVFPRSNPFASLPRDPEPKYGRKPEDYFRILSKNPAGIIRAQLAEPFLLNPVSADEINYCAFGYTSENYFVQLYDTLKYKWAQLRGEEELRQKDMDKMFNEKSYSLDQDATVEQGGKNISIKETIFTYQRNALVHPTNTSRKFKPDKLEWCIAELRKLLSEANSEAVSSAEKSTASSQASRLETGKNTDQNQT